MKKNIILLSFLFASCLNVSVATAMSKVVEVNVLEKRDEQGKPLWVVEIKEIGLDGTEFEEWKYFSTKAEAETEAAIAKAKKAVKPTSKSAPALPALNEEDDDLLPFGSIEPVSNTKPTPSVKVPGGAPDFTKKISSQPRQPSQIPKITLSDYQIPSAAQKIQDICILEFTGSMSPDEVKNLLIKKGYVLYDDATIAKIADHISNVLQDVDGLADVMYQTLRNRSDFGFDSRNTKQSNEKYLKNYLWLQNRKQYISDDLKQALMNRLAYEKLEKYEFLKYANDFYARMMQDSRIVWPSNLKLDKVKETVGRYFQYSQDPKIVKLRNRIPMMAMVNNFEAKNDAKELIDVVAQKIALPVNRPPKNLGEQLQQAVFEQQLEQAQKEKNRLEGAMSQRQAEFDRQRKK